MLTYICGSMSPNRVSARLLIKWSFQACSLLSMLRGSLAWPPTARVQRGPSEGAPCASKGDQPGYPFSIPHLAFLKKLIQNRIFHFGIFIVLERLGKIFHRTLSFPLLGIVLGNAMVSPSIFGVRLEGAIEGFVGGLHLLFAQRQPADRRMCRAEILISHKSRVILLLCKVLTASRFVEAS